MTMNIANMDPARLEKALADMGLVASEDATGEIRIVSVTGGPTDKELLDFLEAQTDLKGKNSMHQCVSFESDAKSRNSQRFYRMCWRAQVGEFDQKSIRGAIGKWWRISNGS